MLPRIAQESSRFSHEVHAAEHYPARIPRRGSYSRKLQRVTPVIGEPNQIVRLIVVAQNNHVSAQLVLGLLDPFQDLSLRQSHLTP